MLTGARGVTGCVLLNTILLLPALPWELGIELTSIPIAGKQTNPIKADIIAALRAKAAASEQ
jgi:hypothetical protein